MRDAKTRYLLASRLTETRTTRQEIIRGFKNMDTAKLLTQAWLVHYNFFKEHTSLGDVPPAVKMGATPVKNWAEVVSQTKTIRPMKITATMPVVGNKG